MRRVKPLGAVQELQRVSIVAGIRYGPRNLLAYPHYVLIDRLERKTETEKGRKKMQTCSETHNSYYFRRRTAG